MTDKEIIALFKAHHPTEACQLDNLGIGYTHIRNGTSRIAYRLSDNLLVKFEITPDGQSKHEILCIRKINREKTLEDLRKHIPTLFYGNKKTGTLIMKYYPEESPYNSPVARAERNRLMEEFRVRLNVTDLHEGNFRMDENGHQVVIDLGWKGYLSV